MRRTLLALILVSAVAAPAIAAENAKRLTTEGRVILVRGGGGSGGFSGRAFVGRRFTFFAIRPFAFVPFGNAFAPRNGSIGAALNAPFVAPFSTTLQPSFVTPVVVVHPKVIVANGRGGFTVVTPSATSQDHGTFRFSDGTMTAVQASNSGAKVIVFGGG